MGIFPKFWGENRKYDLALSCGWRAGEVQKGWESECQSAWEVGEGTTAAKGLSYILGRPKNLHKDKQKS